jgi:hypothetical protein
MPARVLLFDLDELRRDFGGLVPRGADPRSDTTPFRAFRAALLQAAAAAARAPCHLQVAWEGTFNGYGLAVTITPAEALSGPDLAPRLRPAAERVASAAPAGYPLADVASGRATVARNPDGTTNEAPFGVATGHFGAPGMRAIR